MKKLINNIALAIAGVLTCLAAIGLGFLIEYLRTLLFITLMAISLTAFPQVKPITEPVPKVKIPAIDERDAIGLGLMFISGFADGTAEALKHKYDRVGGKWHFADSAYWNPEISWRNKWKNGDPAQGKAFIGSTTFLVWTTDGYHMTRMVRNVTCVAAITLNIGEKKEWWRYILEAVFYYCAYTAGFNIAYEVIWN